MLFISCTGLAWSQNAADTARAKTHKNVLSVNASVLLEKIFKSSLTPDLYNPFVYYQRNFNKCFVRVGVNGWTAQTTEKNPLAKEETMKQNFFTGASVGCYFTRSLGRSFSVAYGLNVIGAYVDSSVIVTTTVDQVENYAVSFHYGIAPGALLRYDLNKHISFFAEYTLPATLVRSENGTRYSLFPEENTTDRQTGGFSVKFFNPLNIYVSCSF